MFKKFNMFALIVLLVVQTMIAPITATAQSIAEPNGVETTEDVENTDGEEITTGEEDATEVEEVDPADAENTPDEVESKDDTNEGVTGETSESDVETEVGGDETEVEPETPKENDSTEDTEDDQTVGTDEVSPFGVQSDDSSVTGESKDSETGKHGFNLQLGSITDLDDNPYGEENLLDPKDQFKLKIDWNLEDGHTYKKGDKEIIELPKGIKIIEEMTGDLTNEFGEVVATYVISTDKKIELTFTEFVEGHSTVKGWLEIISTLDEENVEVEDGEAIIDPIADEGEIRIPIEQGNKDKTIEKKGTPNKGYNADEINWAVTINKNKTSLTNAKVTDLLPEGTEYKEGSLVVTKLKVDLYGNVIGDGEEVDVTGEAVVDGQLTIPLGDIKDAYRIEYTTTVTDDEEKHFKNNATLSDEDLDDISADATITINRGEALKKGAVKGYDPKTGIIEWYLEFNYNQKSLKDVTLADHWTPAGKVELVDGSVTFQEMSIDENGNAVPQGNPVKPSEIEAQETNIEDGFEVSGITTNKAYRIVYQTKVIERELDGFRMENLASFGDNKAGNAYNIGQFVGAKSAGKIDYAAKTIEWTIRVNSDNQQMNNVMIEDTLGEGLTLITDSLEMTIGGQAKTDFTLTEGNPFKLTNIGDTDKEIIVTYKTTYDANKVPSQKPTNKAAITWTPGDGGDSITKDVEAGTELNKETKDSSWKNGSYNPATKEITWTIYTNYRENQIDNLIVTDAPLGNQKIVADSVVVKELTINTNGSITEGDPIRPNGATVDEDANTMKVSIGNTNKAYKIEYKTSLAGLGDIQKEYVNKAEVLDGTEKLADLVAKVGIAKSDTYGEKSGYQDGKQVHWSVKVNLGQQKITNLKLEDTISDNQEYLVDTFKVYHATVDGKGNAGKGEEVPKDQYEVLHTVGEQIFNVKWMGTIERAFIVEYSTLFFEGHGKDVTNTYKVTGDSILAEDSNSEGGSKVTISQLSSGGGSGEAGYLVIDKVGKKDGVEAPLAGAEFDLIDLDTGKVLKSDTTDENGHIDFGRLLFGTYELHERVVPEGYVTKEERQTIEINKKYEPGTDKQSFAYEVLNFEPVFAIELLKTGNNNKALPGAEFTLFDSEKNVITKATTDKDGKILFENLENAGTYYVQETKAPAGYVLDSTKYPVIVGEKESDPVGISVENTARGAVQLTKTNKDTGEVLAGVEFILQKENNSGGYDTVSTHVTDDKGQIKTSNTLEAGNYQFVETKGLDGYRLNGKPVNFTVNVNSSETQKLTMTNEQYKGSVKLIKKDAATNALLKDAEFKLIDADGNVVETNLTTNNKGEIVVNELLLGKYQLIETKAPEGYELDETPIDVEITKDEQVVEKTMTNIKITNISVEKKWNAGGKTKPVTVKLLPTDKTAELSGENNWKATFKNLQVYDESGKEINYVVEELDVDGYKSTVTGDSTEGFTVTNTELTSVSGTKTWVDDNSSDRPESITVKLLANDEETNQSVKVTGNPGESKWTYEFTNLEKYDGDGIEIKYTVEEVKVDGYKTSINNFDITNLRVGITSVKGEKTWKDENPLDRPKSIDVNLSREINGTIDKDFSKTETVKPDKSGKWTYEFKDLEEFDENGVAYTYIVKEVNQPENYESKVDGYDITNVRVGKTEVSGTKRWKDDKVDNRPRLIEINLLRNNVVIETEKVTAEDKWKYNFTDLDKYDENGISYDYTVKEHFVSGYESKTNGNDITNTRSERTTIEVTKGWLDDNSKDRPDSIIVHLLQDDKIFDTVEVKAENDWKYKFTDLEAYDKEGQLYTYKVKEKVLEGYETEINGFNITNLRVGETEITGTKTWLDDDSKDRPKSITVKLLANGIETGKTVEVTKDSNWDYEFTKLSKYDDQGVEITYTVDEEAVDGYEKSIKGNNITNLRVGFTEVDLEKHWKDEKVTDRPDVITVDLLRNDTVYGEYVVTKENDWKLNIVDLPKYDEKGKAYEYSITEHDVPGYASEVNDFEITNTRTGVKTIEITKSWLDNDSEDRHDSVDIELFRSITDGEKVFVDTFTVTADANWLLEIKDLPAFDKDGKAYTYTVEELAVDGYESTVTGFDITNLRVGETSVEGTKTWKDDNSSDRPEMIEVSLLQNGKVVDTQEITEATDWKYNFTELAQYDNEGKEYTYTIEELAVDGYESTVIETENGFDLTNLRVGTTSVEGTKTWKDDNSTDRPEMIKVNLLQNGVVIDTKEVTVEDEWSYSFEDLEKYDENGKAYEYAVKEQGVPGYKSEVDKFNITNVKSEKTSVSVTKGWKDDNSSDRPDSIKVNLLQNGTQFKDAEVTAENEWAYEFKDLEAYDDEGVAYKYTIEEEKVKGYETTIDGYDITNVRVGETSVEGTKTWLDDNSSDRPEMIKVDLLQNGEVVDTTEVTAKADWKYIFTGLQKYDDEGLAYSYEVKEHTVEGYDSIVNGFDITNLRVGETSVEGTKTWLDDNSKNRPTSIVVELLQNGEKITKVNVTVETDWKYSFTDLAEFDKNGVAYIYTVKEQEVEGYSSEVNGYDITNTLIPVTPVPEDPKNPKDPEQPTGTTPDTPDDSGKTDGDQSGEGSKIPKTATNLFNLMLIGLGLLAVGLTSMFVRRKRTA